MNNRRTNRSDHQDAYQSSLYLRIFVFFCIAGSFLYLVKTSWLRWGDLWVDTSRELWLPTQLLQGRILYKDLFYEYGPLAPYLLALLYKIFGVKMMTAIAFGLAITAATTYLLYRISRFFMDYLSSTLAVLTFLFVFAFGHYLPSSGIFNFILPYSFASTLFAALICCGLYLFLRFIRYEKKGYLIAWCACITAAFLTRPDFTIPVWSGFMLTGIILGRTNKTMKASWKYLIAAFIVSGVIYLFFITATNSFAEFKGSVIDIIKNQLVFARHRSSSSLNTNLGRIIASYAAHAGVVTMALIISVLWKKGLAQKKQKYLAVIAAGALFFFLMYILTRYFYSIRNSYTALRSFPQFFCLSIIFLISIPFFIIRTWRSDDTKGAAEHLILFLIGFLMGMRALPDAHPHGWGFCFLAVGILCYYVFFFKIIGEYAARHIPSFSCRAFSVVLLCAFLLPADLFWNFSRKCYSRRTQPIATDYGTIMFFHSYVTDKFIAAIDYLKNKTPSDATVLVYPYGTSLNLFAKRTNPTRYCNMSGAINEVVGTSKIIDELTRAHVDYIVIIADRPMPNQKVFSWILANYRLVEMLGPERSKYPLIGILKKR